MNSKLLGIKRKYEDLVKESALLSSSSSSSDTDSDQDKEKKYKNSFRVKLDGNKKYIPPNEQVNNYNDNKNIDQITNTVDSKNKESNTKSSSLSAFLPPPKNRLTDRTPKLFFEDNSVSSIKGLLNPDSNIYKEEKNPQSSSILPQSSTGNIIELNQNDITDKDWERKYIDKLNQSQLNKSKTQPTTAIINEHNIKNVIEEYKQSKNELEQPIKSKYGKISTKAKYGW